MYPRISIQKNEAVKQIAFFDFDGTVTKKDTLLEFIKHHKGDGWFWAGFVINSPFLVAYKVGLISNQWAKERILSFFFGKKSLADFQQACNDFSENEIPKLLRPKAIKEIKKLQEAGVEIVLVSASPENWIKKWSSANGISLIATRLETRKQRITGKIDGRNCYGEEKVRRIRETYDLSQYQKIYCYGDTKGDKPMLSLGNISFYKPFR